jgi:hypothetical protein
MAEITQQKSGTPVSTSITSHSSDENPQSPETLDSSTPIVDFESIYQSESLLEGIVAIDPDRPPISKADKRKLQNQ